MTSADTQALHESSRLAACLQTLELCDNRHTQHNLVERLAELIDLSDAFTLSEQLRDLPRMRFNTASAAGPTTAAAIKTRFIEERSAMMAALLRKSTPGPDNRLLGDSVPAGDVLLRFYTLQQSEMEHQVLKLRLQLREAIAGLSPRMQQLAMLDAALADTMHQESRKALAALPRLLHKRFLRLQQQDSSDQQWIHDLQSLLLAELDTRLQALTGLLEALDEETR